MSGAGIYGTDMCPKCKMGMMRAIGELYRRFQREKSRNRRCTCRANRPSCGCAWKKEGHIQVQ